MRTRLPAALLLLALTACGGGEPAPAASPSASPTPSPTPAPVVFPSPLPDAGLLTAQDAPAGYRVPDPAELPPPVPGASRVSLCEAPEGVQAPAVPYATTRVLQGAAGFDAVTQRVAVLADEATAVAVVAAVGRHAARCQKVRRQEFRFTTPAPVQTTTLADVVPVSSGGWTGLRQSSASTYVGRRTQRWQTQEVVVRRGNAVLQLEVSGETAPPDLAPVLRAATTRLDALLAVG